MDSYREIKRVMEQAQPAQHVYQRKLLPWRREHVSVSFEVWQGYKNKVFGIWKTFSTRRFPSELAKNCGLN